MVRWTMDALRALDGSDGAAVRDLAAQLGIPERDVRARLAQMGKRVVGGRVERARRPMPELRPIFVPPAPKPASRVLDELRDAEITARLRELASQRGFYE